MVVLTHALATCVVEAVIYLANAGIKPKIPIVAVTVVEKMDILLGSVQMKQSRATVAEKVVIEKKTVLIKVMANLRNSLIHATNVENQVIVFVTVLKNNQALNVIDVMRAVIMHENVHPNRLSASIATRRVILHATALRIGKMV